MQYANGMHTQCQYIYIGKHLQPCCDSFPTGELKPHVNLYLFNKRKTAFGGELVTNRSKDVKRTQNWSRKHNTVST